MIRVDVGVDDVIDAHSRRFRGAEIGRDIADRIDDRSGRLASAAEEIGDGNGIDVQELAQDHAMLHPSAGRHREERGCSFGTRKGDCFASLAMTVSPQGLTIIQ
jgi:hypothetical protein